MAKVELAAEQLQLQRAELARILGLHCDDVSDAIQLEWLMQSSQAITHKAERFILMYRLIENYCQQNKINITRWFRYEHPQLKSSPFIAVVNHGAIEEVIALLNALTENNH